MINFIESNLKPIIENSHQKNSFPRRSVQDAIILMVWFRMLLPLFLSENKK
jgi:hypothetical protein